MFNAYYVSSILFYVFIAVAIVIAIIYKSRTDNRLEYGTAICTRSEDERFPTDIFREMMYRERKKRGAKALQKFFKREGIIIPDEFLGLYCKNLLTKIIEEIKERYPEAADYIDKIPDPFIQAEFSSLKKEERYFNATSYDFGHTGIEFAYIEQYLLLDKELSAYDRDETLDILAYILLHEAAHHDFRMKIGLHLIGRPTDQLMHHVNEYYADAKAYSMMGFSSDDAALNMERLVKLKKNTDIYKTHKTHPSDYDRIAALEEGVFDNFRVAAAGSAINLSKNRTYIKMQDVDFVVDKIQDFKERHKEIDLNIELE